MIKKTELQITWSKCDKKLNTVHEKSRFTYHNFENIWENTHMELLQIGVYLQLRIF